MHPKVSKLPYTPAGVSAHYSSLPASFGNSGRQAASRALLRQQTHNDNEHLTVRRAAGLHPAYIGVHGHGKGSQEEQIEAIHLLNESLGDLFDAVSFFYSTVCLP
jgi:hypothetical protein